MICAGLLAMKAIEKLNAIENINPVLMDIMVPAMDGYDRADSGKSCAP